MKTIFMNTEMNLINLFLTFHKDWSEEVQINMLFLLKDCSYFHSKMVMITTRDSFDTYYMPLVEIKNFDALIDNKPFFNQPVKKNKKRMKNLLKCQEMMTVQKEIY